MIDIKNCTDSELIEYILKSGDTNYFGELYDRYSNKVYRKCYAMVQNEADAEDLTQSILIKTMLNLSKFKGNSSFSTWLYRITYNACLDHFRLKKKTRKIFSDEVNVDIKEVEQADGVEEKQNLEIELARLREIFEELVDTDRILLIMKYQDKLTVPEISERLDISVSAVKMRLHRARKRVLSAYKKKY